MRNEGGKKRNRREKRGSEVSPRRLLLLGSLLGNGLIADKDTFLVIRLWGSPFPDLEGKLLDFLDIISLEHDLVGQRGRTLDTFWDLDLDLMRVTQLHGQHLLGGIARQGFDRGTITDTDQTDGDGVTLCDTGDGIGDQGPGGALFLEGRVLNGDREERVALFLFKLEVDKGFDGQGVLAQGSLDFEGGRVQVGGDSGSQDRGGVMGNDHV